MDFLLEFKKYYSRKRRRRETHQLEIAPAPIEQKIVSK
jgi:hypothetical protein